MLPRRLSNFKAIWQFKTQISELRDFVTMRRLMWCLFCYDGCGSRRSLHQLINACVMDTSDHARCVIGVFPRDAFTRHGSSLRGTVELSKFRWVRTPRSMRRYYSRWCNSHLQSTQYIRKYHHNVRAVANISQVHVCTRLVWIAWSCLWVDRRATAEKTTIPFGAMRPRLNKTTNVENQFFFQNTLPPMEIFIRSYITTKLA